MKQCEWCNERPAETVRRIKLGRSRYESSLDVCATCAAHIDRDTAEAARRAEARKRARRR